MRSLERGEVRESFQRVEGAWRGGGVRASRGWEELGRGGGWGEGELPEGGRSLEGGWEELGGGVRKSSEGGVVRESFQRVEGAWRGVNENFQRVGGAWRGGE